MIALINELLFILSFSVLTGAMGVWATVTILRYREERRERNTRSSR